MPSGQDEELFRIVNRSAAGGVNTRVFPIDIADDQIVEGQNIDASTPGQRVKRQGWEGAAAGLSQGPIRAISGFHGEGVEKELLVVARGDDAGDDLRLWSWNGTLNSWTIAATLTGYNNVGDRPIDIINVYDANAPKKYNAWINTDVSTTNGRYFWDGTDINSTASVGHEIGLTTLPSFNALDYAFNRLWGTGTDEDKNALFYSDVASCCVTGLSVIQQIRLGNGTDRITAAKKFRGREMIVWLENSIESIKVNAGNFVAASDPTTWSREVIDASIGSVSRRSVAPFGQDIYFADQHGNIRSIARTINDTSQGVRSDPISDPIDSWIRRINPARFVEITCVAHDRWLLVSLPIDDALTPSHIFALDVARTFQTRKPTWDGPWTNLDARHMTSFAFDDAAKEADERPTVYIGTAATATGEVKKFFRGFDDGGSDIVYREVTKRHTVNFLDLDKQVRRMRVFAVATANATMCVELNPDGLGWEVLGYVSLLGSVPTFPEQIPFTLGGVGVVQGELDVDGLLDEGVKDIQFRFTVTTNDEVKMLGYNVYGFTENFEWGRC